MIRCSFWMLIAVNIQLLAELHLRAGRVKFGRQVHHLNSVRVLDFYNYYDVYSGVARKFFFEGFHSIQIARVQKFSRPRPLQLPARVQWRSISMSRHNFTACKSKNLSRNLPVQLFISISCSIVSEKLANRGIVWLSNGKGGGLPGNLTEAPLPTRLVYVGTVYFLSTAPKKI